VPRYLLQMQPDQKHAIVVDTQRSRLYLYENDVANGGRPRFVADYYITQGKLGAEKLAEGDKKTPVGVYHVTANLPRQKLTDLYGNGAFPINYPNEWDRRQGRGGSGIWLHARRPIPSPAPRPPTAAWYGPTGSSDAVARTCSRPDAVIISNSVEWLSLDDWHKERDEAEPDHRGLALRLGKPRHRALLKHYSRSFKTAMPVSNSSPPEAPGQCRQEWVKVCRGQSLRFRNTATRKSFVVTFEQTTAATI
jgi:hypothetical protein